jgi:hypothetical protein
MMFQAWHGNKEERSPICFGTPVFWPQLIEKLSQVFFPKESLGKNQRTGDRDMKIAYFSYSNDFVNRKVKNHLVAILLILSVFLALDFCPASGESFPQSIGILYSNNISGEIDPCPV